MMVMMGSAGGVYPRDLARRFPGRVGHLYSPGRTQRPRLPYALDNGRFVSWSKQAPWDAAAYERLLCWAARQERAPLWAIVPDVVGDAPATRQEWDRWAGIVAELGVPLAYAVQDGATAGDVPDEADVVFVGGTKAWKWATVEYWATHFHRVHVGRVNSHWGLWRCHNLGVESVDGTGWFPRAKARPWVLVDYFERSTAGESENVPVQCEMFTLESTL